MRFLGSVWAKNTVVSARVRRISSAEAPANLQNRACCACFADSRNKPELLAHFKNLFQPGV